MRTKSINEKTVVTKFISQDYNLIMSNTNITDPGVYNCYLQWLPTSQETQNAPPAFPTINLSNSGTQPPQNFPTLTDSEFTAWSTLYSKTKVKSIHVKYMPAQTMGVTNGIVTGGLTSFASQNGVMYTVPTYDNVDKAIAGSGTVTTPNVAALSAAKIRPYAREHSIYKPWTRIIRPSCFLAIGAWNGAAGAVYFKKNPWTDITQGANAQVPLNGLYIIMPSIQTGGERTTAAGATLIPGQADSFTLGKITMTYVQMFKCRE